MITAKEAAKHRTQLRRELERDYRAKQRERIQGLRVAVKEARRKKTDRLRGIVATCKTARKANAERIKEMRVLARERINARAETIRGKAREKCGSAKELAREAGLAAVDAAKEAVGEEVSIRRTERIYSGGAKGGPGLKRAKPSERAKEEREEVTGNIPQALVPVWERMQRKIKATPRMTLTESFLQWAHDHPADVLRIQEKEIERDVERLAAAEAEERERLGEDLSRLSDKEMLARYDQQREAAVPF